MHVQIVWSRVEGLCKCLKKCIQHSTMSHLDLHRFTEPWIDIQWNPSNPDTIGLEKRCCSAGVSLGKLSGETMFREIEGGWS